METVAIGDGLIPTIVNDKDPLLKYVPKEVICNYFVICGNAECVHAKPHAPLYRSKFRNPPSVVALVNNNCYSFPFECGYMYKEKNKPMNGRRCIKVKRNEDKG